jgi:hypothetical protein
LLAETEQEDDVFPLFVGPLPDNITTLTAIDPVAEPVCADALEIINRLSKQLNAAVDFAKTRFAFFLKNK